MAMPHVPASQVLAETIRWCLPRFSMFDIRNSLQTLTHDDVLLYELGPDELEQLVLKRASVRRDRLGKEAMPLDAGRILKVVPSQTLSHGLSVDETGGFLDEDEVPPVDTWILTDGRGSLLAWVPDNLISAVDIAISVNAEACIQWAGDASMTVLDQLNSALAGH